MRFSIILKSWNVNLNKSYNINQWHRQVPWQCTKQDSNCAVLLLEIHSPLRFGLKHRELAEGPLWIYRCRRRWKRRLEARWSFDRFDIFARKHSNVMFRCFELPGGNDWVAFEWNLPRRKPSRLQRGEQGLWFECLSFIFFLLVWFGFCLLFFFFFCHYNFSSSCFYIHRICVFFHEKIR